jgi:CheY-like chemotaxis protein
MTTGITDVLCIDDDVDTLDALAELLRIEGFTVASVETGEEGLAYLRSHGARLVLVDLLMNGMSGSEVVLHMRQDSVLARVPVVLLTAARRDMIPSGLRVEVLPKPLDVDTILALVRHRCRERAAPMEVA